MIKTIHAFMKKLTRPRELQQNIGLIAGRGISGFFTTGIALMFPWLSSVGAESEASVKFRKEVSPILQEYCYDCHGDGSDKGNVAFDALTSDSAILDHDLWLKVL